MDNIREFMALCWEYNVRIKMDNKISERDTQRTHSIATMKIHMLFDKLGLAR